MAKSKIVVMGGGSFGTAIANILAENDFQTVLWVRDAEKASAIQTTRENKTYLPNLILHNSLQATADMTLALQDAEIVFVSVPSKVFRSVVQQMRPLLPPNAIVVSTAKGIETGENHQGFWLMSDVLKQELPTHRIAVLSGPNLAGEIAEKQLTGTVVASSDAAVCQQVQDCLRSPYFRVYSNNDVYGVNWAVY